MQFGPRDAPGRPGRAPPGGPVGRGLVWRGLVSRGLAWRGLAWRGLASWVRSASVRQDIRRWSSRQGTGGLSQPIAAPHQ